MLKYFAKSTYNSTGPGLLLYQNQKSLIIHIVSSKISAESQIARLPRQLLSYGGEEHFANGKTWRRVETVTELSGNKC